MLRISSLVVGSDHISSCVVLGREAPAAFISAAGLLLIKQLDGSGLAITWWRVGSCWGLAG
jgi:hypothetical protein